jgi:hypothetical protein
MPEMRKLAGGGNGSVNPMMNMYDTIRANLHFNKFAVGERLFRDVQAARYHPLSESDQVKFSGEYLLRD